MPQKQERGEGGGTRFPMKELGNPLRHFLPSIQVDFYGPLHTHWF
jgi:hypothetical protein